MGTVRSWVGCRLGVAAVPCAGPTSAQPLGDGRPSPEQCTEAGDSGRTKLCWLPHFIILKDIERLQLGHIFLATKKTGAQPAAPTSSAKGGPDFLTARTFSGQPAIFGTQKTRISCWTGKFFQNNIDIWLPFQKLSAFCVEKASGRVTWAKRRSAARLGWEQMNEKRCWLAGPPLR